MKQRPFWRGVLCGVLLVFALRWVINRTVIADWIISPLLMTDNIGSADAIVTLGAGVVGECAPNQHGVRRVLLAARLWREKRAPVIVFTGGTGTSACPVSVAMATLAREIGVSETSIRLESTSRNTTENAERTAPLLRAMGATRVLLVTDRLHMRRSERVFAREGFEVGRASVPIYEGHPDNVSMLRAGLREFLALGYYRMRGWTVSKPRAQAAPPAQSRQTSDRPHGTP